MLKELYRFFNPRFQNLFLDYKVNKQPRYGHGKPPHHELNTLIQANEKTYQGNLEKVSKYYDQLSQIKNSDTETSNSAPTWNNEFLPGLDIVMLYTMVSEYQPKNYIEIGSGNSTKVVRKAIAENNLSTQIISIDPYPRAEIDEISDVIHRTPFEDLNLDLISQLGENDILFIDNSHRIFPNSDSMVFFMEVLPKLKKGVIVQVHDIYLPFDYPQFMCDRFYSEQYGLALFLLLNPKKYETIMPNYYVSETQGLSNALDDFWNVLPFKVEKHGGSYWIRITE